MHGFPLTSRLALLALALAACAGDDGSASATTATEGATTEGTSGSTESTTTATTATTMTTTATTVATTVETTAMTTMVTLSDPTTEDPSICGDGIIGPGESCDDGNNVGGDGCEADCTLLPGAEWWREVLDGGDMDLDVGYDVATDAAGNIYVVATVIDPFAKSDIFIRKYDPIGVSQWTRQYDGGANQNDLGVAITGDAAGFMIVAGRQTPQGSMVTVPWMTKCDPNGQILWQVTEPVGAGVSSLAMFSNTHYIAAGSIKDGMDTNAMIRRYDGDGSEVWTSTFVGTDGGPDSAADVAVDGAGNLFVAGREFTDANSFNAWLARYSAAGDLVWSKTVDGPLHGADWASAIAVDDAGWLVVGGRIDMGADALGDAWLARYTIDGVEVWSQTEDGPAGEDDAVRGLAIDGQGQILAVGHRGVVDHGADAFFRKLDGDGVVVWDEVIDGPGGADDEAVAVAVDGDDNAIAVGTLTVIDGFDSDVLVTKRAP